MLEIQLTSNQQVGGSSPPGRANTFDGLGQIIIGLFNLITGQGDIQVT